MYTRGPGTSGYRVYPGTGYTRDPNTPETLLQTSKTMARRTIYTASSCPFASLLDVRRSIAEYRGDSVDRHSANTTQTVN